MAALASIEQLEARLGRAIADDEETRAQALLDDASATVRSYTGQQFSSASSTQRLSVRNGRVRLPQRPVVAVSAVRDDDGNALAYRWPGEGAELLCLDAAQLCRCGGRPYVVVDYDHGYTATPDDIVAVVCNVAGRALGVNVTDAATSQQSISGYSESFGPVGAAGPVGLFSQEIAVLDRYKRVGTLAWVS